MSKYQSTKDKDMLLTLYRLDQIEKRLDLMESKNQTKEILELLLPVMEKKVIVPTIEPEIEAPQNVNVNPSTFDNLLSFARRRTII